MNGSAERAKSPFAHVKDHVLLQWASELREVDEALTPLLTADALHGVMQHVPDAWLADATRDAYVDYFLRRLEGPRAWVDKAVEEAARARTARV
jgi:hypothetical protein